MCVRVCVCVCVCACACVCVCVKRLNLLLEYQCMQLPSGHYTEVGILVLEEIQILAAAKYIIRGPSVVNHANAEAELGSDKPLLFFHFIFQK